MTSIASSGGKGAGQTRGAGGAPPPVLVPVPVALHPLRQREVLSLYAEFKSQHEDGVCKVRTFQQALRLHYPTESKAHIHAMMNAVIEHEAAQERADEAAEAAARDVQALFEAIDI